MLRAVTFDLWNTLIHEGPGGLIRPRAERWRAILAATGHDVDLEALESAHRAALAKYQESWRANRQFQSAEAVVVGLDTLGLEVDDDVRQQLVESFHHAGLESDVVVVPGAIDVLTELRRLGLRTAIVCDIGLTPSSALEDLLQSAGVLPLTDVQMWSDVREIYKPDPAIFRWTIEALGVEPEEAIHVGDRLRTDVEGARRVGMMSVRFNGVYDDQDDVPEADLVIDDLRDLVTVLGLAAG